MSNNQQLVCKLLIGDNSLRLLSPKTEFYSISG